MYRMLILSFFSSVFVEWFFVKAMKKVINNSLKMGDHELNRGLINSSQHQENQNNFHYVFTLCTQIVHIIVVCMQIVRFVCVSLRVDLHTVGTDPLSIQGATEALEKRGGNGPGG